VELAYAASTYRNSNTLSRWEWGAALAPLPVFRKDMECH
jgi:hypothetical protein